jgi:hypothetical protein
MRDEIDAFVMPELEEGTNGNKAARDAEHHMLSDASDAINAIRGHIDGLAQALHASAGTGEETGAF